MQVDFENWKVANPVCVCIYALRQLQLHMGSNATVVQLVFFFFEFYFHKKLRVWLVNSTIAHLRSFPERWKKA